MSNLLEKASIVTTPTAYDNGKILSVKPAPSLGVEKIVNGTFDENVNGWITNNANASFVWQINKTALFTSTSFAYVKASPALNLNAAVYKVSFDILSFEGTLSNVHIGLGTSGNTITTTGSYTYFYTSTGGSTEFQIRPNSGGTGSITIDNVSVKEVIDGDFDFTRNSSATRVNSQGLIEDVQILSGNLVSNGDFSQEGAELITNGDFATDSDWLLGTGWSIGENKAVATNSLDGERLRQNNVFTAGKTYKVTYEITEITQGSFRGYVGGTNLTTRSAVGVYTEIILAPINDVFYIRTIQTTSGSIDNVSVKEVGQDWTFSNVAGAFGWRIANKRAICDAEGVNNGRNLNSSTTLVNGKTYKLTLDILQSVDGMNIIIGSTILPSELPTGTNLAYEYYIYASQHSGGLFSIYGQTSDLQEITNISLIEITDDTNLPRINYEGFSYQDSLGSELVVNGGFDSDTAWSKGAGWSISNGTASHTGGTTSYLSQSILEPNKQYKVKIKVSQASGNNFIQIYMGNSPASVLIQNVGEYEYIFTSQSSIGLGFALRGALDIEIDNVSVKEYLGQEVVPDSGRGSWLFEPQSTNLIPYSEDFTEYSISTTNLDTPTIVSVKNPSGVNSASLLNINNGVSASKFIYLAISTSSSIHTQSIFVKYVDRQWIQLLSGGTSHYANFDIQNGVVGNTSACSSTIEDYGNGWYRCTTTLDSAATPTNLAIAVIDDNTATRLTASTGTGSYYLFGSQVEQGSYATSYIPTNGSTVTRLQDAAFGSGSSDLINSTEGVLYAEVSALANDGTFRQLTLSDNSTSDRVSIDFTSTDNQIRSFSSSGGSTVANMTSTVSDANQFNKVAVKYKLNDYALWINGVEVATDTNANVPIGLNELSFDNGGGSNDFYGNVKCVAVFKEALTDEELECLTTI